MAATDQIRQMVNFILQEAHEKANEIRVKVCLFFKNSFFSPFGLSACSSHIWWQVLEETATKLQQQRNTRL